MRGFQSRLRWLLVLMVVFVPYKSQCACAPVGAGRGSLATLLSCSIMAPVLPGVPALRGRESGEGRQTPNPAAIAAKIRYRAAQFIAAHRPLSVSFVPFRPVPVADQVSSRLAEDIFHPPA